MILFNQLALTYGSKLLFTDVTLKLTGQNRYALVGANGTGKSTLLRLISKEETPDYGTISLPKEANVGWLKQDQYRYEETNIIDIVLQGKSKLWQALAEKQKLLMTETWDDAIGYRLGELEETIAHQDGYAATALAEKILIGLGITADYHEKPLKALSGGFKLRVLLAQTLFQQPDILLLDEPTNHLDIVSIDWLEKYLRNEFQGLLLFISHDVEFINRLATNILDIDYGEIRQYSGQYEKFLAEKQLIAEQKLSEKKSMEAKISEMQRFVDRFRASATRAKQAQARVKMIEKIELPDIKHSSRIAPNFQFKPQRASGKQVLKVKKLSKSYQENQIFSQLNFKIERGEKVAIVGANGAGKSTLMKILLKQVNHDDGEYQWGYESQLSYFSQDHHESLKENTTIFNWLMHQTGNCPSQTVRKALAQVLFTKDDVDKNILTLSGGEAARLLLAKMMLEHGNVMLLDEPTNHLDLEAIEALADALKAYPGTLLLVSHNRHFIHKVATRVLFLDPGLGLRDFEES